MAAAGNHALGHHDESCGFPFSAALAGPATAAAALDDAAAVDAVAVVVADICY